MEEVKKNGYRSKEVFLPVDDSFNANDYIENMINDICVKDNWGHFFKDDGIRVKVIVEYINEDK